MKTVAIIQARMGSTRLPGKVLRELAGEPMLGRVVDRLRRARGIDQVVVATTVDPRDDALVGLCGERGWACTRGSEDDVLDRYRATAEAHEAAVVVRVTSDCPLIDPGVVDEVIAAFHQGQPALDYVSNFYEVRTFPRGLDTEVFRRDVLDRAAQQATDLSSREHVTPFIFRQPQVFRLAGVQAERDFSAHRWTVDTPEDFRLVETIYQHFGHDRFDWREVLALLDLHPEWAEINRSVEQKPF